MCFKKSWNNDYDRYDSFVRAYFPGNQNFHDGGKWGNVVLCFVVVFFLFAFFCFVLGVIYLVKIIGGA